MPQKQASTNLSLLDGAREAGRGVLGFTAGFRSLFKGLRFVYVDHRELSKLYIPPMIIALLFVIGAWLFFAASIDTVTGWIWDEPTGGFWRALWSILAALIFLVLGLGIAILVMVCLPVFVAPFNDLLSERIEDILGTWQAPAFSFSFLIKDLGQTIALELRRAGIKLLWLAPLFLFSFVPVVGSIVYFIFGSYFLTKYTGMDYIDWCAARRGWTWSERMAFARKHRWTLCGLGSAVVLSLLIPLAFPIVWPGAVAAGTLLFTQIQRDDAGPPGPRNDSVG